jgi:hypothetical protein
MGRRDDRHGAATPASPTAPTTKRPVEALRLERNLVESSARVMIMSGPVVRKDMTREWRPQP